MNFCGLIEKWGPFVREGHYMTNGIMKFISSDARLNVIFDRCDDAIVNSFFSDKLGTSLLPELKAFYEEHNGCRLFFGSLSIFGIASHKDEVYVPFDLYRENINNLAKLSKKDRKKCRFVFFGSLGGDYLFAYDKEELSKIYVVKAGSIHVLQEYDSFDSFWTHFYDELLNEYDENCYKIHPNVEDEGIPALENVTYKLF